MDLSLETTSATGESKDSINYEAEELKMLEFQTASVDLDSLLSRWQDQKNYAWIARRTRYVDVNVEQLQKQGFLASDETLTPVRLIDQNIRREQPAFVNFLINSRRLVTFQDLELPNASTQELEDQFTSKMRYDNWEMPWFKEIDGAQTFGWDSIEVEFDLDKPLQVGLNHIGNENLIFPPDSRDIQGCERIAIRYELTRMTLRKFVEKYGFDKAQVDAVCENKEGVQIKNIEVYKVYTKVAGVVWVSWYAKKAQDWLKAPEKLYLGRNRKVTIPADPMMILAAQAGAVSPEMGAPKEVWEPEDETQYPVRILIYNISEQPCITNNRGRVFLDQTKQEAQTALMSGVVNGCNRAANTYAFVKGSAPDGAAPRQVDCELHHGRLYNQELGFFNTPWPDPLMIKASESIGTQAQQESGQVDFAVANRQDSRKTATEIDKASEQSALLSSVQVSLFSNHIQEVYSLVWSIVQSRALQGKISLLKIAKTTLDSVTGQQVPYSDPITGKPVFENDFARIERVYIIKAAGDVDVIERDEKLKKMMNFWPVIQTTPLNSMFLQDIVRLAFPEDAARYIGVLQAGDPVKQLLGNVANALQVAVTDDNGMVKPEFKKNEAQLTQLAQQVQATLNPPANVQNSPS